MKLSRLRKAVMVLAGAVTFLSWMGSCVPAYAEAGKPTGIHWREWQRKYDGVFVLYASRESRKVALTFDDVPDPRFTPKVLDVLKRKGVHGSFFVMGNRAKRYPELVRRIHEEGHNIGNHSYNHPDYAKMSLGRMQDQVSRTENAIMNAVGFRPKFIRPPYGEIVPIQLEWAKRKGYTVVNWDVDSSDWRQLSADQVFRNVTRSVKPGSVILMHAGGGTGQSLRGTVEALPKIIDWLREHDYEPVTLTELLKMPEKIATRGSGQ